MKSSTRNFVPNLIAFFAAIVLWVLIGKTNNIIPSPLETFTQIFVFLKSPAFYDNLFYTLTNVIVGVSLSIILAVTIVSLLQLLPKFFEKLLSPFISTALFVPAIIAVYILIIIFGYGTFTICLVIIFIVTPNLIIMFESIIKQIDTKYFKISHIYHIGRYLTFKKIILPQIISLISSTLINGFSLAIKIDILTEAIIGNRGIGYLISYNFYLFDLVKVLALTIIFISMTFYLPKLIRTIYLSANKVFTNRP